jgi:hypothetical protein
VVTRINGEGQYIPEDEPISWNGIHGYDAKDVLLQFTYDPFEWSIYVEGKRGEEGYTVIPEQINDFSMELAPYSARYIVSGSFISHRNTIYDMKFYFEVDLPDMAE